DLAGTDVTCNNGNDGSFAVTNVYCGVSPFMYSVDGGAFVSVIPTNLTVGLHAVVVSDINSDLSATYTIEVGDALAPSNPTVLTFTSSEVEISWDANGSETQWNIEWGVPGFTPGTGAEIGAAVASATTYTVTGLTGNTD